ncbi:MAG: DUF932 domain-containing protein [Saprospiraceae bacterium]
MKNENLVSHDELNDILFSAEVKETSDFFGGKEFASNLSHCVYLPQKDKVVQLCGGSYELVHNRKIILPIYDKMRSIFGERGFKTEIDSFDDRRFYVRFIVDGDIHSIIKGDDICPTVEIRNSYDGTVKQTVGMGYNRLICENGLMAFTEDFTVSVKHSKKAGMIDLQPIYKKLENVEVKLEQFKRLSDRVVTPDELIKIIHAVKASPSIKYPRKMIEPAKLIAEKEALQLKTDLNAWLVYNGFNNPLNHFETKLLPEEISKIDSRVLRTIEKTLSLN